MHHPGTGDPRRVTSIWTNCKYNLQYVQPGAGDDPAGGRREDPVARPRVSGSISDRPPPIGKDDPRWLGNPAFLPIHI